MEERIVNLLTYSVKLIKILIVTTGIMGFRLKKKWYRLLVLLPFSAILLTFVDINIFLGGLLAVGAVTLMLEGKHKFFCTLLSYLSIAMLDISAAALTMFITRIQISELYNSALYAIAMNVFSVILILTIAFVRKCSKKSSLYHIKHMRIAYIITSIISQICFLLYLTPVLILGFDDYSKPLVAVGLSFSGVFFIVSNILLVESIFSKWLFKSLYDNSREQSENLLDYVDTRIDKVKERQKIYHDMPYHLLSLQALAKNKQYDELKKYISRLTERFSKCGRAVNTGNHQLNAIIAGCINKYPDIKIKIIGIMPNEINIPHHDFCVIMSNLIDNAFKMTTDKVKLEINLNETTLYIRIANPVKEKVIIVDNMIQSANIGTLNVIEYADKNNGKIFYRCNDKYFIADLYLNI